MGGFAGKARRKKSARAIAARLVKGGYISKEEAQGIRRHISKTGVLGAAKLFLSKKRGSKRSIYQDRATIKPKVKKLTLQRKPKPSTPKKPTTVRRTRKS